MCGNSGNLLVRLEYDSVTPLGDHNASTTVAGFANARRHELLELRFVRHNAILKGVGGSG